MNSRINSKTFIQILFFIYYFSLFFKSYLFDLNFMCPGCVLCITYGHCMHMWPLIQYSFNIVTHHFFKRKATVNDLYIDKDLLLNLNLYPVTYGHILLVVLTAVCSR